MKFNDLSGLSGLLTEAEKQVIAKEAAEKTAKRKIGEGHEVRVLLDTKMRRGKSVTVISELALSSEMRDKLAKELRQKLSAGGTVHNDIIEIQGDHVKRAVEYLESNGFKVRTK